MLSAFVFYGIASCVTHLYVRNSIKQPAIHEMPKRPGLAGYSPGLIFLYKSATQGTMNNDL